MQENLPDCKVAVSTATLRSDNGKLMKANNMLQSNIDIIDNRNINSRHLSGKGLH